MGSGQEAVGLSGGDPQVAGGRWPQGPGTPLSAFRQFGLNFTKIDGETMTLKVARKCFTLFENLKYWLT